MRAATFSARQLLTWLAASLVVCLTGCERQANSKPVVAERPAQTSAEFLPRVGGPATAADALSLRCARKPGSSDASPVQEKAAEVTLEVVKYDPLIAAIRAQRGHVVVIDFWGDFCVPCKREFPNLVHLQQRHAQDGVVCMSLSVDPVERREAALNFLKAQKAVFPNYLLDEDSSVWQTKWNLSTVPAVLVFYRDGTRAGKFDDDDPDHPFSYDDVEQLVQWVLRTEQ